MPKTFLELWVDYCNAENPVTRVSLRQCIRSRLELNSFEHAYFYLGILND